jgi:hypothetical protein
MRRRRYAWVLAAALSASGATLVPMPVCAQSEAELDAARKLFAQAMKDQGEKRYDVALDEFRRVAQVRDTANVRYRIATCLEALGHNAAAVASYELAAKLGEGDATVADAVRASKDRAAQLSTSVARLTILLPDRMPADADVRVDDVKVDPAILRDPLVLEAGHHTISATATGAAPFRTAVTLTEGGRVSITVPLEPSPPAQSPDTVAMPAASAAVTTPARRPRAERPSPSSHPAPTVAYVVLGAGGLLAGASIVALVLREENIHTIDSACTAPAGGGALTCPPSRHDEVSSVRSAAELEGPLAAGFAVASAAAIGVGLYLLWSSPALPASRALRVVPVLSRSGGALELRGAL